jgi:DNA-binding NarL/FixJ family response regulator
MGLPVLIIEDHEGMRDGLRFIVSGSGKYECADAVATAEAGLKAIRQLQPGIVMMDLNLPTMSGIECTQKITAEFPGIKVLVCTVHEDEDKIFRALAAGASGYILKKSTPAQIIEALDELCEGGSPISSRVARKMVDFFQQNKKSVQMDESLTERELDVLSLLASGFRNKEIGEKLFLSVPTVKSHLYNIYRKLHVQSRIAAVKMFNQMRGFDKN